MKFFKRLFNYLVLMSIFVIFAMGSGISGVAYAIDLQDVKEAIQAKNAGWTAGETALSELPIEVKKARLGLIVSDRDQDDLQYAPAKVTVPASYDWRDYGKVTQVRDQKNCGSCWAFSAVGAMESLALMEGISSPDYSEQFLVSYNIRNSGCRGGAMVYVNNFLKKRGTVSETCMPYRAKSWKLPPPCSGWADELAGIDSWSWVSQTVNALKTAVYENPVSAAFYIYEDFYYYEEGVYEYVEGDKLGGHAIVIVGYDDAAQCFIVKNSWGPAWGENGYFRIGYSQVTNLVEFGSDASDYDGVWQ